MEMMTDVETGGARPVRSPDTKAAFAYLVASGATAITITDHDVWLVSRRVQARCARLLGALAQRNASDRSRTPSLTKAFSDYEQKNEAALRKSA